MLDSIQPVLFDDPVKLYPHPAAELAKRYGVDEKTVNWWCREGCLPPFKGPGGAWWVRPLETDWVGLKADRRELWEQQREPDT